MDILKNPIKEHYEDREEDMKMGMLSLAASVKSETQLDNWGLSKVNSPF